MSVRASEGDAALWAQFHALVWLVVGNAVGVLMAVLLIWPRVNQLLAPFTFGRWVPLHLDFHLYGWCSFPLLALLFDLYLPKKQIAQRAASVVTFLWSAALAFAGWRWLHGQNSGKIFLEWEGSFRFFFPALILVVWGMLALGFVEQLRSRAKRGIRRISVYAKGFFLVGLATVPLVFFRVLDAKAYPVINYASGGPTGTSLLGSILGVVVVFWLLPLVFGVSNRHGLRPSWITGGVLVVHFLGFGLLTHGDITFPSVSQILALGSALVWIPLVGWYYSTFKWPSQARAWIIGFGVWGILLSVSGVGLFLPEIIDRWKFTGIFVAHSHLAMAGMMTSFNVLILLMLNRTSVGASVFDSCLHFALWHAGLILHLVALVGIAYAGGNHSEYPFSNLPASKIFFALRLAGGTLMLIVSIKWLVRTTSIIFKKGGFVAYESENIARC